MCSALAKVPLQSLRFLTFPIFILCHLCLSFWLTPLHALVLNNPYPAQDAHKNIYYTSFNSQPKTLDPARAYISNEYLFMAQIYEPLLQYHFFARPYQLQPLTAMSFPEVYFLNKYKIPVARSSKDVAYSVYRVQVKKGIMYQPHPAFALNAHHQPRYSNITRAYLNRHCISELSDFKYTGTRELRADDYIYQIKRLATPRVSSPIYGLMSEHILGFAKFKEQLPKKHSKGSFLDLRLYPLEGVRKLDDYTFEITLNGQYSQFLFWLAMPFFAPIPWEADKFYSQPGMDSKNLNFSWYPVGTGPFWLAENNPNRRMLLNRNQHYRNDLYPSDGSDLDKKAGYLKNAGRPVPMIDSAVYTLEKESIPRWNKFLQGYYDASVISADSFDQAIKLSPTGKPELTQSMREKNMHLEESTDATIYYLGFNMLDPVVGGNSLSARKLRQAIAIAIDYEEYINIFYNGRGKLAQSPIPDSIFGQKEGQSGMNPNVYQWVNNKPERRPIAEARRLLKEAGYDKGQDKATGQALILHYDVAASPEPDDKARMDWMRKQFASLGIKLDVRATEYNRFQEKLRSGNAQIFSLAWIADYPDPENFLFLLYGKNGKALFGGENASNYSNPEFDVLFDAMKNRENDAKRQQIIDNMLTILRRDVPMIFGINTQSLTLTQSWVSINKPNAMTLNTLKYIAIDVNLRNKLRQAWNQAILWPIALGLLFFILCGLVFVRAYYKKEAMPARRISQ